MPDAPTPDAPAPDYNTHTPEALDNGHGPASLVRITAARQGRDPSTLWYFPNRPGSSAGFLVEKTAVHLKHDAATEWKLTCAHIGEVDFIAVSPCQFDAELTSLIPEGN